MVSSCLTQPLQLCNSFWKHDNLERMDLVFPSFWCALHEQILRYVFDRLDTNGMVYCAAFGVVLL